jgi:hypothetical protein
VRGQIDDKWWLTNAQCSVLCTRRFLGGAGLCSLGAGGFRWFGAESGFSAIWWGYSVPQRVLGAGEAFYLVGFGGSGGFLHFVFGQRMRWWGFYIVSFGGFVGLGCSFRAVELV